MHVGRAAFVHQLGLRLRIEILRDDPHDAQDFPLPRQQARRGLFKEVKDVLLRQLQQGPPPLFGGRVLPRGFLARHSAPQVVEHLLVVQAPLAFALFLRPQVGGAAAGIAVHGMAHERMRGVEQAFDLRLPVAFLALHDEAAGEFQVVQDAVGIGPLLEQVVVLEKMVMPEGGVRNHQRLHRGGVFLHDIADAGIGVDDDLVCQPLHAGAIHGFIAGEVLAERPVLVEQRHADRGIGVQHLFGADDLDLVRVAVQPEFLDRDLLDGVVAPLDR